MPKDDAKPNYTLRKAKKSDSEGIYRFPWLVVVDGSPIAGLECYEPTGGWRGKYLKNH